ncbi:glycoside hydrolase family 14 protein [Planoprotostelium fungivorum]|uniref:Beta-amylase n=1 Tax=Planoprotostelium fungivorum TaxID=1890364 RepID=A0A2P6NIH0_9EUKA|nr:glycoside hydrolase family 14 protein [Planoprotostelium fungivorum]
MKVTLLLFIGLIALALSVPTSVMMPLDLISRDGVLKDPQNLETQLKRLKEANVNGIMVDVWWGIVERYQPKQYNWKPYQQLYEIVARVDLHLQPVMSFHQCGTNVGDQCYVPLPDWVLEVGKENREFNCRVTSEPLPADIFYHSTAGDWDQEYLSLGVDDEALFQDRTPVDIYNDFFASYVENFGEYLGNTTREVQIGGRKILAGNLSPKGLGPAGELRYPSYQLQDNKWSYCGIGAFQAGDKYMQENLKAAAEAAGHSDWNHSPDAGSYNSRPDNTKFFTNNDDNFASPYGQFFLGELTTTITTDSSDWYTNQLLVHAQKVLSKANGAFQPLGLHLAAKVTTSAVSTGGMTAHTTPPRPPQATSNTGTNMAYDKIARVFAKCTTTFDFTRLKMKNQNGDCESRAEDLVTRTKQAANSANIGEVDLHRCRWLMGASFSGKNALPICGSWGCDWNGFNQVLSQARNNGVIKRFTFLRLDDDLVNKNMNDFSTFVNKMQQIQ